MCMWDYEGEIDENGFACGRGVATFKGNHYEGTFFLDRFEGIGIITQSDGLRIEGEFTRGTYHGKVTFYWSNQTEVKACLAITYDSDFPRIENKTYEYGVEMSSTFIGSIEDAYYKKGRPNKVD